ncbi:MAG: chemotaxis protein CheA [Burkholderiaceae bacterium]|nr:chemotaxis protein CheA [Burkholderiaceae bacterium]
MTHRQDDDEILAAARAGFLEEADELLAQFEQCLLGLESDPQDAEIINAAFRAAHTIKGTAGLFGCDAVVGFTHEVETLLEAVRAGRLAVDEPLIAVLLQSRDQMERLLDEVRAGRADTPDAGLEAVSRDLGGQLRALLGLAPAPAAAADATAVGDGMAADPGRRGAWQISLRLRLDALRNGLDPLSFIRYLATLGTIEQLATLDERVPALDALDAEDCHLGFEIRFTSESADQAAIEQVFEFLADDCELTVLAPDAAPARWDTLLTQRCGDDAQARTRLLALWTAQGVQLPLRDAAPAVAAATPVDDRTPADTPAAELPAAAPQIERRAAEAGERRRNEPERRAGAKDRRGDDARFLRVSADKLDRLIDLIGELVIAGSGAQLVAQREASPAFLEAAQRIHDLVQEARDGALSLRMVPIGETFARFQRVVRDVSKGLGKEVELEITGGDTELDKSMVEAIADPLMHLVRNSLDHGIESAEDRAAAGKSPRGRLALNAYHESGLIVIEVSDDGRGLPRERILAKAIERGLVEADQPLSDAEVNQLIFAPGFSTAEKVTDLSGRGVGMDVVKRNIDSLRGQIHIASTPGAGTTMQIRLPLTLAIIDGFLTTVGETHYVVPLEGVVECIETPPACKADDGRLSGCFDLRGEVLPYVDLRRAFRQDGERPARQSMLLVRTPTGKVGLLVDRLLGEHQTVLKPLGRVFQHLPGIAGSTVLGSGEVALVLDLPSLVAHASVSHAALRRSQATARRAAA